MILLKKSINNSDAELERLHDRERNELVFEISTLKTPLELSINTITWTFII